MTALEAHRPHQDRKQKPTRVISPTVVSAYMTAAGIPDSLREKAETQVRKILRQAKPVRLQQEPKNTVVPSGAKVEYVEHWMKPGVVYRLCTFPKGPQHCDMVVRYDKEGRPGFRK